MREKTRGNSNLEEFDLDLMKYKLEEFDLHLMKYDLQLMKFDLIKLKNSRKILLKLIGGDLKRDDSWPHDVCTSAGR